MAFAAGLRRAAAAAALSACSFRATTIPQTHRSSLLRTLPLRNILPLSHLCSLSADHHSADEDADHHSADEDADLLKILDSEIGFACKDCKKEPQEFPNEFPFEIEDEEGTSVIILRRSHGNEEVEVVLSMPVLSSDDDKGPDDENKEKKAGKHDVTKQVSIPLTVNVSKRGGRGMSLEFGCSAYPEWIEIDAFSFKRGGTYEGPPFNHLDDNLQKALHKYLEKRGISNFTTILFFEYMINKDNHEYLSWLKNLRRFIG